MEMPHRRRWAIIVTVSACIMAIADWLLGRLSGRPLSAMEVIGLALGVAAIVGACSGALFWAAHSNSGRRRSRPNTRHA